MSKLRKNLRGDKRLNAFNEAFDLVYLSQEIDKAKNRKEDARDITTAVFSPFFNALYADFYKNTKHLLAITELTIDEIEEAMLANANRNFLLIGQLTEKSLLEQFKKDKGVVFGHADFAKIKSEIMNEEIYAGDAADNAVDGLNMLFSYLQFKERAFDDALLDTELSKPKSINRLVHLYLNSGRISAFKNAYDSMIWEDRYVVKVEEGYKMQFKDRVYAILARVNKLKIEQLSTAHAFTLIRQVKYEKSMRETLEAIFRARRKPLHIKSIKVQNGYIIPEVAKGFSSEHIRFDISIYTSVVTSYEYIIDTVLPNLGTLTVNDIIVLYAELRELVNKTYELKLNTVGYLTIASLYNYPFRISSDVLIKYLASKTDYTEVEIASFVNLLSHKGGRINFWETPFIKKEDDLLFLITPIVGSKILYIIDEWLEAGGFSLDERGHMFERHIKISIKSLMDEKGYMCNIYKDKFIRYGEEKEEVDLLVEFKECIFIAEVKCIRFPLEARDNFNAHKRLAEGATQLNRKIHFLNKYKEHFAQEIPGLLVKPIVKAVIANYSLLSTHQIDGVALTDITTIEYYIQVGGIDKGLVSVDKFGARDASASERIEFYNDESEFCQNFHDHLINPISLNALKSACSIETVEMTEKAASIKLFVEGITVDIPTS